MHDAILLIDDDPLLCRGLAVSLQRQGFRVLTAGDVEQGLELDATAPISSAAKSGTATPATLWSTIT